MNQAVIERSTDKAEDFPGRLPGGAPNLANFKIRIITHTGVAHRHRLGLRAVTIAAGFTVAATSSGMCANAAVSIALMTAPGVTCAG
jgi:hypothetical protein